MDYNFFIIFAVIAFNIFNIFLLRKISKKQLELTYKRNGGVPFNWEYEIEDNTVVECVKSYVKSNENKGYIAGGAIYTSYVFKGLKEGETAITFRYVNITNGDISKTIKNHIKVDKNNNIFEIKKN